MKYSSPVIKITKFEYEEFIVASSFNDDLPQEEF